MQSITVKDRMRSKSLLSDKNMSTYVHYSLGREDGIKCSVMEHMNSFYNWLKLANEEYPGEYDTKFMSMANKLVKDKEKALCARDEEEAYLVDRVIDEISNYQELENIEIFKDITPSEHKWSRYAPSLHDVVPNCTDLGAKFYRKIFSGCSIAELDNHTYQSDDGVYRISWLLPKEVTAFKADIDLYNLDYDSFEEYIHGIFCIHESLKKAEEENVALTYRNRLTISSSRRQKTARLSGTLCV